MTESKQLNQGAVSTLADADLVMTCDPGGTYRPVSLSNLKYVLLEKLNLSRRTAIDLKGSEWIRVARGTEAICSGILSVSHSWNAGRPVPLVCSLSASTSYESACHAEQLTKGSFYKPSSSDNQGLSFTAIRFVKENDTIFVEVRLKAGCLTGAVSCSIAAGLSIDLLPASVSTAQNSNVFKTIEFSGGG